PPRDPPAALPNAAPPARLDRHGDPLPAGAVARLGTVRFRIPDVVRSLAFAPDGKTLAVSSHVGVFLLDAASGKRTGRLAAADSHWAENPIAFSPDGKRLAARGGARLEGDRPKRVMRVWELAGGGEPRTYDVEHAVWVGW